MDRCLVCHSTTLKGRPYPGNPKRMFEIQQIKICENCNLGAASPMPLQLDLDEFYQNGEYWGDSETSEYTKMHQKIQARYRFESYLEHLPEKPIDVLEIGAGFAYLADFFLGSKKVVNSYVVVEPDKEVVQESKDRVSNEKVSFESSLDGVDKKFDVVIINHVIEHVSNPVEFIKKISNFLKPKGLLFVECPRHDFLFKQDVFPHTLFFDEKTLECLAEKVNLKFVNHNTFGSAKTIKEESRFINKLISKLFLISVDYNFERIASFLDNWLFEYKKKSDQIWLSVVMKKL